MNKHTFALLAGATGLLLVNAAQAGQLSNGIPHIDNGLLRVQVVCDQHGNCREEHHDRPAVIIQQERHHDEPAVVIQQDRHYQPQREHHEARPQQHGQPGIGINVPGVSIGVGGGDHDRR